MAERLSLELELLDKVGGPAKKAAAALRGVEVQAKKTQGALDFSKELSRTKDQLTKIRLDPKGFSDLIRAQKSLREEREKMKKSLDGHGGFLSSLKSGLKEHLGLEGLGGKLAKASFWGHLGASAVVGIGEGFLEGAHKAVEILYDGIKEAFGAIAKEQERRAGYELTLGPEKGKEAREDIERFSKQTAFSASQNQDMMLPLFRAGLEGRGARTAYAAAQDLAAARGKGADTGAVSEAVETFAKIQQKGGVTTKQLAGIGLGATNVPAFYKDLGAYLHISAKEAEKRASKPGGIDPSILLDRIYNAIEKQQGGQIGTGGDKAGKSLAGQWNKLKALPEEFFNKLADSPALPKISAAITKIFEKFDPNGPTGQRIFAALSDVFDKIAGLIATTFTPENIDKFLDALSKVPGYLSDALKVGEALVAIFVGGKLLGAITTAITGVAAIGAPIAVTAGAIISVAVAFERIKKTLDDMGGFDRFKDDLKVFFKTGGGMGQDVNAMQDAELDEAIKGPGRKLKGPSEAQRRAEQNIVNANVTIVAAPGEDPAHTHQRAAVEIGKHLSNAVERAAAEGG